MSNITLPNPRVILPPLIACLPTAFLAPKPPPALLPLLSPILRQRVSLQATSQPRSKDGWLPLLTWNAERAERLAQKIEHIQVEPHPVSGELELGESLPVEYRRLDSETLQCKLDVIEFDIRGIFVWCENDSQDSGPGWRLAELMSIEDVTDNTTSWVTLIGRADASFSDQDTTACKESLTVSQAYATAANDDDYWAMYDQTPGQNSYRPSPMPTLPANGSTPSEQTYYDRYTSEVQPALDAHDPDTEFEAGSSSLQGDTFVRGRGNQQTGQVAVASHPTPSVPTSVISDAPGTMQAENGIRHHIGNEIKSLFRLASSVGIDREEFQRVVSTELELLVLAPIAG